MYAETGGTCKMNVHLEAIMNTFKTAKMSQTQICHLQTIIPIQTIVQATIPIVLQATTCFQEDPDFKEIVTTNDGTEKRTANFCKKN